MYVRRATRVTPGVCPALDYTVQMVMVWKYHYGFVSLGAPSYVLGSCTRSNARIGRCAGRAGPLGSEY